MYDISVQFEEWEQHYTLLGSYIKTQTTPHIFYLPKAHNKKTTEQLDTTKLEIKGTYVQWKSISELLMLGCLCCKMCFPHAKSRELYSQGSDRLETVTAYSHDEPAKNIFDCVVFLGLGHLEKMQQELRDMVEDRDPPMLKSPAAPANNRTLNESMDDDSKDHDLGELEGQPAELNIMAQHEEEASVQQQGDGSGLGSGLTEGEKGEGVSVDEVSDSVSNRVAVGGGEGDETPETRSSTPTGSNKMDSD